MKILPLLSCCVLGLGLSARAAEPAAQRTTLDCDHADIWSVGTETKGICTGSVTLVGTDLKILCDRLEFTAVGVGDKTALVLVPLAMASGVVVPMMCGVEHDYVINTLEKLAAVPGCKSHMTNEHFAQQQERPQSRRDEACVLGDPPEPGALGPAALEDRTGVRVPQCARAGQQLRDLALERAQ